MSAYKKLRLSYKKYSFLGRGSDERQFNSPHVDLKISSIMRSKHVTYKEYHTSLDNFKLVNQRGLDGGFKVAKEAILNLMKMKEKNEKIYVNKSFPISRYICEPQLGKRNLSHKVTNLSYKYKNEKFKLRQSILNFLQYADGTNDLNKISKYICLSINRTKLIQKICKKHNLLN